MSVQPAKNSTAKITEKLSFTNRAGWRKWLKVHHNKKQEIWLIYYKKHTKKPTIAYNDAVEEALCFGWIDSTVRKLDSERYMQKFTPRKPASIWAQSNIRRVKKLIKQGKMTPAGLALFNELGKKGTKAREVKDKLSIPSDLKKALALSKEAITHFKNFAACYQKMYIWWIINAKRDETRVRRIKKVVEWAKQNKKLASMKEY